MRTGRSSTTTFEELLDHLPEEIGDVAATLREHIQNQIPGAEEIILTNTKTGIVQYTMDGKNSLICEILPSQRDCKLYFYNPGKLKQKGLKFEGTAKNGTYLKLSTLSDFDQKAITKMLNIVREDYFLCR